MDDEFWLCTSKPWSLKINHLSLHYWLFVGWVGWGWRVSALECTWQIHGWPRLHRTRIFSIERTWTIGWDYCFVSSVEIWWRSVCQVRLYLLNSHRRCLARMFFISVSLQLHRQPFMAPLLIAIVAIHHLLEEWILVLASSLYFSKMMHGWRVWYHLSCRIAANHTLRYSVALWDLHFIGWVSILVLVERAIFIVFATSDRSLLSINLL